MDTDNGHTLVLNPPERTWLPSQRNMHLLEALAFAGDLEECDLDRTLERALMLLRDEMLNGPTVVVADTPKRGGRKAK